MTILGIESSCDECSASVVLKGKDILSNVVASQVDIHRPFDGVVPEIASRTHTEWIQPVVTEALRVAGVRGRELDGIAVTNRPGLIGSLLVGLSFAKGYAFALEKPFAAVDHIRAHLYAPHLEFNIEYPYIGLIVSGGHTIISKVESFDHITILGTTIDDACGEAFDKVAKFYGFGYPGGVAIDRLARNGDDGSFSFPDPSLRKGEHRYDVSYSGLKTAVINQIDQFRVGNAAKTPENISASFEKTAIDILLKRLMRAKEDTGIRRIVAGGGVAANTYFRARLANEKDLQVFLPSIKLCTDNGAMIAGIGYHYLAEGGKSDFSANAYSRVQGFRRTYP
ncbi:MAG: tRNA (adenosine(37)-N6)-threonylcarbamoyltransferase complex transferase subunit TsaD [Spirochaetales bacterium]|nr:tRNA (adenosine(37)-N6)-threonylcarbamoyltransferase complex transferase subunit TsaD [Spirochaetales bacterium]